LDNANPSSGNTASTENADLSQHFEQVMLADVGEPTEDVW
jgi:hypothetical protein